MALKDMSKNYINVLKVLAMLFVVCMHVISKAIPNYQVGTSTYNFLIGLDIILRTSVPLFVLISGNLVLNRKYSIKDVIVRLIEYYVFFIIFNSMYMILDQVFINKIDFNLDLVKNVVLDSLCVKTIYQMWYFKIIFITYASIPLFQFIISKNNKILDSITLGVLIILFQVLPWFVPVFYSNYTYLLVFLTYFYLGYYVMKYTFKFEDILMLIALIVSFIFTYNKTIALDHDYYFLNFIFFNVMFMSVSIFKLSKNVDKIMINKSVNNVVRYLAKLSFPIFLLHGMVIGGLSKCGVINIYTYDNLLFILSNTLIVYFISGLGGVILYDVFNIGRK